MLFYVCSQVIHSVVVFSLNDSIEDKIRAVATKIYGASDISLTLAAKEQLQWLHDHGLDKVPICMAKTPLSFSHE
jgi:formyltetrahydrofolate synthetase